VASPSNEFPWFVYIKIGANIDSKGKDHTLEQAMKAQRESRGVALHVP
jgi:hypothetical protein